MKDRLYIPRQTALDCVDKILEICNFTTEEDWNKALDLRNELKEYRDHGVGN